MTCPSFLIVSTASPLQQWERCRPVDGTLQRQWRGRYRAVDGCMLQWQRQWWCGCRASDGCMLQRQRPCWGRRRAVNGTLQRQRRGMHRPVDGALQWQQCTLYDGKGSCGGVHGALQCRMTTRRMIALLLANNRWTNDNQPNDGSGQIRRGQATAWMSRSKEGSRLQQQGEGGRMDIVNVLNHPRQHPGRITGAWRRRRKRP
jgi:hypothetical protein